MDKGFFDSGSKTNSGPGWDSSLGLGSRYDWCGLIVVARSRRKCLSSTVALYLKISFYEVWYHPTNDTLTESRDEEFFVGWW